MTRIFGTLGPACAGAARLERMLRLGMTGVRLNLSHRSLLESKPMTDALREAAERAGVRPELVIDLQGPELRIGALESPLPLREGEETALDFIPGPIREGLRPGQELLLDDGKLLLSVCGTNRALVRRGGTLTSRKSLALPGLAVELPALTDSDRENLALAREAGVTGVMQPFVRSRADLTALRSALTDAGAGELRLYAKVENREGLAALPDWLDAADEIVIARGDLGNAMPLWELPAAQKRIAALCRERQKPFMVVTQMLASMERSPVPTRAEVCDVFNAVLDGASSVMVTGETAVGGYPEEVIRVLTATVREAEHYENNITET
ncbi:MAG: pyruvate kinase [Oscillospiraceae bacterium]|nr:pyruvate kinase [Oscillospiraceae bacterium]